MLNLLGNALSLVAGALAGAQGALRYVHQQQPRPMPRQIAPWLDSKVRMHYLRPDEALSLFGLVEGMHVLDAGCGTGAFTLEMARMVGTQGVVHAVDLQATLLEAARRRLAEAGLEGRVRLHHDSLTALPLDDETVDLAVAIASLSEIPDRLQALLELRRVLKPGGRLAVTEELIDPSFIPAGAMRAWAEDAGFRMLGSSKNPLYYSLVFVKEA